MNIERVAWYRSRAEWHGKMAAYCIKLALKGPEWDDATGAYIGGTDELSAMGYIRDAYAHARCATHFALLVKKPWFVWDPRDELSGAYLPDVGADVPGGGAS